MEYWAYPHSCRRIERACKAAFAEEMRPIELSGRKIAILHSESLAMKDAYRGLLVQHLLWMLIQLQGINGNSGYSVAKRGRWIGWVYAYCEWLGLLTQQQVRTMARRDARERSV